MRITWDEPKRLANLARHELDFAIISLSFFETSLVAPTKMDRFKFIGEINRELTVVIIAAPLGKEAISIISLRRANRKERTVFNGPR